LLLIPAKLKGKTEADFKNLESDWVKPENLKIATYSYLGHKGNKELLDEYQPDLIIADEAHYLKNKKASVTKRVIRYMQNNPETLFVPLSGTMTKRSFMDWWHLQIAALPAALNVLPTKWMDCDEWCCALDEKLDYNKTRMGLGALSAFGDNLEKAREGYGKFLRRVPGVIASDVQDIDASIIIDVQNITPPMIVKYAIDRLKEQWELPDGTELCEALEIYRHARTIANGFYYRWSEEPPAEWLETRREFNSFIRSKLNRSRKYDSPAEIRDAYSDNPIIIAWEEIKNTYTPVTEPVWLTHKVITDAVTRAKQNNALLWYEHRVVGDLLSLFLPTYGQKGNNLRTGKNLVNQVSCNAIAVSIGGCSEGFNLQSWNYNIMLQSPSTGSRLEQLIGRTHRAKQMADSVTVDILTTCDTQKRDFLQALSDAEYTSRVTGQNQKLTIADINGIN